MPFSSRVRVSVEIRVSGWLLSGHAYVFVLLSVVIVKLHAPSLNSGRKTDQYMRPSDYRQALNDRMP